VHEATYRLRPAVVVAGYSAASCGGSMFSGLHGFSTISRVMYRRVVAHIGAGA